MKAVVDKPSKPTASNGGLISESAESLEVLLQRQAGDSQRALLRSVHGIKSDLRAALRPQVVTRSHPWFMTGAAAVVGYAAASIFLPRSKKRPEPDATTTATKVTAASGLFTFGLAALARFLQSPAGMSMLSGLWSTLQTKRQSSANANPNGKNGRRS